MQNNVADTRFLLLVKLGRFAEAVEYILTISPITEGLIINALTRIQFRTFLAEMESEETVKWIRTGK